MSVPRYRLNDGHEVPAIGFGTYPLTGDDAVAAVTSALDAGYRLIDTAVSYDNETEVGEALRRSGVRRDEVVLTSKLPGRDHGYDDAVRRSHDSLRRLGIDYLDLHLIHARLGIRTESWSPLCKRRARFAEPAVAGAAQAHGVTSAQVILRWQVQCGSVPIPKSATPTRQRQNLGVFGFDLAEHEMDAITALGRADGRLFGGDPDTHQEM